MAGAVLVIDQGTTSTRSIVFGEDALPVAIAKEEFPQHFPHPGWVEHDPEDLWRTTLSTARAALAEASARGPCVVALGITNQRETTLIWDRKTGQPIHNAIVWQDRRTAPDCAALKADGAETLVGAAPACCSIPISPRPRSPGCSTMCEGARERAMRGELAFGTVDSFLLWRMTNGAVHATDATNASRTALYDIRAGDWDDALLALFRVPRSLLPVVMDCAGEFGTAAPEHFGEAHRRCAASRATSRRR